MTDERDEFDQQTSEAFQQQREQNTEPVEFRAESVRLQERLHPECPKCGLRTNLAGYQAVVYCEECYSELEAENAELREKLAVADEMFNRVCNEMDLWMGENERQRVTIVLLRSDNNHAEQAARAEKEGKGDGPEIA